MFPTAEGGIGLHFLLGWRVYRLWLVRFAAPVEWWETNMSVVGDGSRKSLLRGVCAKRRDEVEQFVAGPKF